MERQNKSAQIFKESKHLNRPYIMILQDKENQQNKMNSSELLKSLNSQNHGKHKKKKQLRTISQDEQVSGYQDNEFEKMELPLPPPQAPSFLTDYLKQQESSNLVTSFIGDEIAKVRKQKQRNAYLVFNNGSLAYLKEIKNLAVLKNSFGAKAISDFMGKRYNNVTSDLENGKLHINLDRAIVNKQQMEKLTELDVERLIKIKDGAIRSKLDLMNERLEQMEKLQQSPSKQKEKTVQQINKKLQENLDLVNYGLKSEKTKIARDYIKHMNQQRKEMRKREQLRQQRRKKIQEERQAQLKEAEQMKDQSKKQQILNRIEVKKKKREEEQKNMNKKQAQIQKFLAIYKQKVPIYKKKKKQYEDKFVKPEKAYHEERLKQIKEKKKSYSLNDIVDHQKKYEQIKQKQLLRKSQQKQLIRKETKVSTKQYYRGSVHSYVEEIDRERKEKNIALYQLRKQRKERMLQYSKVVDETHKPKIDQKKRSQILQLLEAEKLKKNKLQKKYKQILDSNGQDIGLESYYEQITPVNRYQQGNKFLQIAKLRKKRMSHSVALQNELQQKRKKQEEQLNMKSLRKSSEQIKEEKAETQRQIWELRAKHMQQMSHHLNSPKQFQQIKVNFQNFDRKAADKQSLLKNSRMSMQDHIVQKGALDLFYIESIKQKMKLLE